MESFLIALNAVMPFFIYIAFGYLVRTIGIADESFLKKLNQMVFKVFFPIMMFCNLYTVNPGEGFHGRLIATALLSLMVVIGISVLIVPHIVRENPRRGVVIQALYRSNVALFMIPLTASLYGESSQALATMLLAFMVPLYNVMAVIILEVYRNGDINPVALLKNIIKNPMICGAAAGFLCFLLKIKIPACVMKPLQQYSDLCTPLGMFVLGGTLKFSRFRTDLRCVTTTLAVKMVVIPAVMLGVGFAMGFSPVERFNLLAIYATPVAASSYPMAQSMGGDGDLAGELVVMSTLFSVVTLFWWIYGLDSLGLMM